ncbi:MAG: hypothetical protein IPL28_16805 [Chloroflexi bacterium]|nr:hypothetical protein [Chloroflexota bacterium]
MSTNQPVSSQFSAKSAKSIDKALEARYKFVKAFSESLENFQLFSPFVYQSISRKLSDWQGERLTD